MNRTEPTFSAGGPLGEQPAVGGSYALSQMLDGEAERARLGEQAQLLWAREEALLRERGFCDGGTFLDLGSGTGQISVQLARAFPGSQVIGVEPDAKARGLAEAHAAAHDVGARCRFLDGRAHGLPLADASIDGCYARLVVQHLPDPQRALAEVRRATRPGGAIVIADIDDAAIVLHPEPAGYAALMGASAAAQRALGGDRHVGRKLHALLAEAGWRGARSDVVPLTSEHLDMAALLHLSFSFRPELLEATGTMTAEHAQTLAALASLSRDPRAWMLVGLFVGRGLAE